MNAIKQIHSENGEWSSKRVYGGLMLIVVIICVFTGNKHPILDAMLWAGVGLIGLATTVQLAQAIKGKPQPQQPPTPDDPCG